MEIKLQPIPHILMKTKHDIRGWYSNLGDEKPRTCTTEHFLVNPYMGYCHVGCKYCYINVLPNIEPPIRYKLSDEQKNHRYTIVDLSYPERINAILNDLQVGFCAYIQPFNECFNPLEEIYHLTQATAYEFVKRRLPISFTTKRVLPDWAVEYLKCNKYNYVHYSINTGNQLDYGFMSPGASAVIDLLQDIEKLSNAGIYVAVRLDPLIPGISFTPDWNMSYLKTIIDMSIKAGAKHFVISMAEIKGALMKPFIQQMQEVYNDETVEFFKGCMSEYFKSSYKCKEDIKIYIFDQLTSYIGSRASYSLCTEHFNYKDLDGSGYIDLNDDYMTGTESCHGMQVPIHIKSSDSHTFVPLEGCLGSCLRCTHNVCNIDRLKYGMANKLSHYKKMKVIL